jgi:hypothetical protein
MKKPVVISMVIWAALIVIIWTILMEKALTLKAPNYPFKQWVDLARYVIAPWALTFFVFICSYVVGDLAIGSRMPKNGMRDIFVLGIGLGITSTVTFLIGLVGLLYSATFLLEAAVILAVGWRRLFELWNRIVASSRTIGKWRVEEVFMIVLMLWYVYMTIAITCNPSIGWDTGNSHLAAPKWYLHEHAIHFQPWINFNNFPQLVEMLGMYVIAGVGDPGATVSYLFLLGQCFLIYGMVQDRQAGLIAVLVWLSMPFATRYSQEMYVEMALAFYCLLAMYGLVIYKRWDLAGLAAGCALSVKYTAAPYVILLAVLGGKKGWWKFLLWSIPIAAPWYLRNIVLFGNPVFPFMDTWARIPGFSGTVAQSIRSELIIDHAAMLKNFKLPWQEIIWDPDPRKGPMLWWTTMTEREPWVRSGRPASTGPWLLAMLPVMVLAMRKRIYWGIAAVILAYLFYWILIERIWDSRYLVMIWPVMCVIVGWGIKEMKTWVK